MIRPSMAAEELVVCRKLEFRTLAWGFRTWRGYAFGLGAEHVFRTQDPGFSAKNQSQADLGLLRPVWVSSAEKKGGWLVFGAVAEQYQECIEGSALSSPI